ncbi:MAG: YeeE/YedE family protein, partial [Myxococcales bacterium]|nr:YeeE/YedE family protein [Myxococcales bacterium]
MEHFTPLASTLGGLLIGLAAALLLLTNGRIAGVSGIAGGLLTESTTRERGWRAMFVAGLLIGGLVSGLVAPTSITAADASTATLIAAGLLVGLGTRLGSGCTSGHGVCG